MIYLRMLLQEDGAATKVQEGNILTCPKTFFTLAGIIITLPDDDKKEGEEEGEKKEEEEEQKEEEDAEERRQKRRRMKRKCKALMMNARFFTCPKTFSNYRTSSEQLGNKNYKAKSSYYNTKPIR